MTALRQATMAAVALSPSLSNRSCRACRHGEPARRKISDMPARPSASVQASRWRKPETRQSRGLENFVCGAGVGTCRVGVSVAECIQNDIDSAVVHMPLEGDAVLAMSRATWSIQHSHGTAATPCRLHGERALAWPRIRRDCRPKAHHHPATRRTPKHGVRCFPAGPRPLQCSGHRKRCGR